MFGFFKKKEEYDFENKEIVFFKSVISILPKKYSYLGKQVMKEFILGWKPNKLGYQNSYTFLLNANLEKKFERKDLPQFFIIKNIRIWENNLQKFVDFELDILTGLLAGFKSESVIFGNFNFKKTDLSQITEKHFNNDDKEVLLKIVGDISKEQKLKLDIEDSFKIDIPEGTFYTIKNLGEGNYLSVNEKGEVYELLHDPYSVKKKASSINELLLLN